jgi:hypothetical protein
MSKKFEDANYVKIMAHLLLKDKFKCPADVEQQNPRINAKVKEMEKLGIIGKLGGWYVLKLKTEELQTAKAIIQNVKKFLPAVCNEDANLLDNEMIQDLILSIAPYSTSERKITEHPEKVWKKTYAKLDKKFKKFFPD